MNTLPDPPDATPAPDATTGHTQVVGIRPPSEVPAVHNEGLAPALLPRLPPVAFNLAYTQTGRFRSSAPAADVRTTSGGVVRVWPDRGAGSSVVEPVAVTGAATPDPAVLTATPTAEGLAALLPKRTRRRVGTLDPASGYKRAPWTGTEDTHVLLRALLSADMEGFLEALPTRSPDALAHRLARLARGLDMHAEVPENNLRDELCSCMRRRGSRFPDYGSAAAFSQWLRNEAANLRVLTRCLRDIEGSTWSDGTRLPHAYVGEVWAACVVFGDVGPFPGVRGAGWEYVPDVVHATARDILRGITLRGGYTALSDGADAPAPAPAVAQPEPPPAAMPAAPPADPTEGKLQLGPVSRGTAVFDARGEVVGFLDDRDARGLHLARPAPGDAHDVAADAAQAALAALTEVTATVMRGTDGVRHTLYAARSRAENTRTVLEMLGRHFADAGDGPGAAIPAIADLGLRGSLDPVVALRTILDAYKAAGVQYRNAVRVADLVPVSVVKALDELDTLRDAITAPR